MSILAYASFYLLTEVFAFLRSVVIVGNDRNEVEIDQRDTSCCGSEEARVTAGRLDYGNRGIIRGARDVMEVKPPSHHHIHA